MDFPTLLSPKYSNIIYIHSHKFLSMPNLQLGVRKQHYESCGSDITLTQQVPADTYLVLYFKNLDIPEREEMKTDVLVRIDGSAEKNVLSRIERGDFQLSAFLTIELHIDNDNNIAKLNYEIYNVCTATRFRNRGIIKSIFDSIIYEMQYDKLWIGILVNNPLIEQIIHVYTSVGFSPLGIGFISPHGAYPGVPFVSLVVKKEDIEKKEIKKEMIKKEIKEEKEEEYTEVDEEEVYEEVDKRKDEEDEILREKGEEEEEEEDEEEEEEEDEDLSAEERRERAELKRERQVKRERERRRRAQIKKIREQEREKLREEIEVALVKIQERIDRKNTRLGKEKEKLLEEKSKLQQEKSRLQEEKARLQEEKEKLEREKEEIKRKEEELKKGKIIEKVEKVDNENLAKRMISNYAINRGRCQISIGIEPETLSKIEEIFLSETIEYGGVFEFRKVDGRYLLTIDYENSVKGNTEKYEVKIPLSYINWHTHPFACYLENRCFIGWPSGTDMAYVFRNYNRGLIAHFLFSVEGIYYIYLDEKTMSLCRVLDDKSLDIFSDLISKKFSKLENYRSIDYDKEREDCINKKEDYRCFTYDNQKKHNSIEQIVGYINNITWNDVITEGNKEDKEKLFTGIARLNNFKLNKTQINYDFPIFHCLFAKFESAKKTGLTSTLTYLIPPEKSFCPLYFPF